MVVPWRPCPPPATVRSRLGSEPLVSGFVRVPFGDSAAVEALAAHHKNIVAVLVEPYQGEGGVQIPQADYLVELRRICDAQGWLLMLDECILGSAHRTGLRSSIPTYCPMS